MDRNDCQPVTRSYNAMHGARTLGKDMAIKAISEGKSASPNWEHLREAIVGLDTFSGQHQKNLYGTANYTYSETLRQNAKRAMRLAGMSHQIVEEGRKQCEENAARAALDAAFEVQGFETHSWWGGRVRARWSLKNGECPLDLSNLPEGVTVEEDSDDESVDITLQDRSEGATITSRLVKLLAVLAYLPKKKDRLFPVFEQVVPAVND